MQPTFQVIVKSWVMGFRVRVEACFPCLTFYGSHGRGLFAPEAGLFPCFRFIIKSWVTVFRFRVEACFRSLEDIRIRPFEPSEGQAIGVARR